MQIGASCLLITGKPLHSPERWNLDNDNRRIKICPTSIPKFCDWSRQLQGVPGPPGPKCRKSLKKVVLGLSARSAKKVPQKSKKSRKSAKERHFRDFFDFFSALFGTGRSGTTFLRLFRHFGPGGPDTPCNWSLQSRKACQRVAIRMSCTRSLWSVPQCVQISKTCGRTTNKQ